MIRRQSGQAAIELAALAPVLALAVLVFAQLALAFRAELAAERAAGRGQAASVLGRPVLAAARARAPEGTHARLRAGLLEGSSAVPRAACVCRCRSWRGFTSSDGSPREPAPRTRHGRYRAESRCSCCSRWYPQRPGLRAGRGLVLDERVHGSADAVALAAANVLARRYGDGVDGLRLQPSLVSEHAARLASRRATASQLGVTLGRSPSSAERTIHRRSRCACAWPRERTAQRRTRASRSRSPSRAGASASPTCGAWMPAEPSWRLRSRSSAGPTSGAARAAPRGASTARG